MIAATLENGCFDAGVMTTPPDGYHVWLYLSLIPEVGCVPGCLRKQHSILFSGAFTVCPNVYGI